MSVVALYASLFEPNISEVVLQHPPMTHQNGPQLLNVLKVMDIPQAAAIQKGVVEYSSIAPGSFDFTKLTHELIQELEDEQEAAQHVVRQSQ